MRSLQLPAMLSHLIHDLLFCSIFYSLYYASCAITATITMIVLTRWLVLLSLFFSRICIICSRMSSLHLQSFPPSLIHGGCSNDILFRISSTQDYYSTLLSFSSQLRIAFGMKSRILHCNCIQCICYWN